MCVRAGASSAPGRIDIRDPAAGAQTDDIIIQMWAPGARAAGAGLARPSYIYTGWAQASRELIT